MSPSVDKTVLIVSALAVFFATLFATLVVLEPEPTPPSPIPAEPTDVAAAPVEAATELPRGQPAAAEPLPTESGAPRIERKLEELGVKCGVDDCFPDP